MQIPCRKFGSGNGANTGGNYWYNPVFREKGYFNRVLTVQYSGGRKCAKNRQPLLNPGDKGLTGAQYDRK